MSTPCVFDCIRKHLREESSSCESLQDLCRFDNEIMIKIIRLSSKGALIIAVFLRLHTISLIFGLADGSVQWHRSQSTALALNSHLSTFHQFVVHPLLQCGMLPRPQLQCTDAGLMHDVQGFMGRMVMRTG